MFKRTRLIAAVSVLFSMVSPAFAQDVNADTVVATVNGTDITVGHMIVVRETLPEQYQSLPPQVLFDGVLDQLIQQSVLAQSLDSPSRALELRLENEQRTMLASEAMVNAISDVITDDAIQAAYEARFADAAESREYNASHILVPTEEEALELITALEGGADFAELAKEKSTGPSGPNGGELGWFGPGMMVKPFEDAVFSLEVGAISPPVSTQFGWHVLTLNDSRLKRPPAIEEVRQELVQELQQSAIEDVVAELTEGADIVRPDISMVSPEVLSDAGLVE
jgi:peptidyl-prolyl cis-trans isomerase C